MTSWEYLSTILTADINYPGAWNATQEAVAGWDNPPVYTSEALIPQLNYYGRQGWELVSLQPVQIGKDGEVRATSGTNSYLAVFKRRQIT
ncbi:MAG: DUF4177 domain-containing protein [Caldilineaceae bacterium]